MLWAAPGMADQTSDAEDRTAIVAAAAEFGCAVEEPARDIKQLNAPLAHIHQVKCADSHIIWFHKVDGEWTLKPLG